MDKRIIQTEMVSEDAVYSKRSEASEIRPVIHLVRKKQKIT